MAVRIVQHAFEIINLVTEQNPIQVLGAHMFVHERSSADCWLFVPLSYAPLSTRFANPMFPHLASPTVYSEHLLHPIVDAVVNTGPREDSTRIGSQGTVRRQAVDVSPLRRVNQAITLLTTGVSKLSLLRSLLTSIIRIPSLVRLFPPPQSRDRNFSPPYPLQLLPHRRPGNPHSTIRNRWPSASQMSS